MLHVAFLRNALGNYSVQCPQVDIGPAFAAAANAALGMDLSPPFSPYTNELFFLHGAFIFEDLGVTAYKGAASLLQDPTILSAAAGKLLCWNLVICCAFTLYVYVLCLCILSLLGIRITPSGTT